MGLPLSTPASLGFKPRLGKLQQRRRNVAPLHVPSYN